MNKRSLAFFMGLSFLVFTGCNERVGDTNENEKTMLTAAPDIVLVDSLSSASNEFRVSSSNYTWSYLERKEMVNLIACGSHPLDEMREKDEKLNIPEYNKIDGAPYLISSIINPDEMVVKEWEHSQIGNMEAEVLSTTTYEDTFLVELVPDRVYEIIATWDEEKLEENGFYGEASYVVITEKQ